MTQPHSIRVFKDLDFKWYKPWTWVHGKSAFVNNETGGTVEFWSRFGKIYILSNQRGFEDFFGSALEFWQTDTLDKGVSKWQSRNGQVL